MSAIQEFVRAVLFVGVLSGCSPAPLVGGVNDQPASLHTVESRFVVWGSGHTQPSPTLAFTSEANGSIELTSIDDPPLVIGLLVLDRMSLRSSDQAVATLDPGEWYFLLLRDPTGSVDAMWLSRDTPREVRSLARFVVSELQQSSLAVTIESAPVGLLEARYFGVVGSTFSARFRARRALDGAPVPTMGVALMLADTAGPIATATAQITRRELVGNDQLVSRNVLLAIRTSVRSVADPELDLLREQIAQLSESAPVSLVEPSRSQDQRDTQRRQAETWDAVLERLRVAIDPVDHVLIDRASAHLSNDDALPPSLTPILREPSSSAATRTSIFAALAACGTSPCQVVLLEQLGDGEQPPSTALLSAFTQIHEPTADLVDHLVDLSRDGDESTRRAVGVVLSRFGEFDPQGAAERIAQLIDLDSDCPPELDRWFGLLGNAGLPSTKLTLTACLDASIPVRRRAAAALALRRIAGPDITEILVGLALQPLDHRADPHERVRLACLRALSSRAIAGDGVELLEQAPLDDWGPEARAALSELLDRP